ncbi:hypothetical protein GCM10011611_34590 [Aliidongia dinghuensis]|uniref:Surface antigen domain-containing protein n=2 Tax=Aliidongia dinghuensis TaxID=1867774 RepID=A0A8J2YV42_9PROT|nr:hypothetical protein GCM10011611_34590 [Aliidongia dinghuensis]
MRKEVGVSIPSSMKTALFAAGAAVVLSLSLGAASAEARTFVSVGVGLPLFYAPPPPVVYAPPPVVYAPPPVTYAPAYEPAPAAYAPPAYAPAATQTCREYQSTIQVNGQPQQSYGTACLQPDGTWRIVQ